MSHGQMLIFPLLDMSQIKKFFGKIKSEVKFAKAGEGHRLNEPSATPRNIEPQSRPQVAPARTGADTGAAARAAAEAAQLRMQQQARQQSTSSSKRRTSYLIRSCNNSF